MKHLMLCLWMGLVLSLADGCKVPEITYSYQSLTDSLRTEFQREKSPQMSIPDSPCIQVYQALYPYCGKIKRHLEESTMENTLAMDGKCDGDTISFHRFSLVVLDDNHGRDIRGDTVLLFSSFLKDYYQVEKVHNLSDTATALGAVTVYVGTFTKPDEITFTRRMVYTKASNCKIPLFCFSRDDRFKGKPVVVNMKLRLSSPFIHGRDTRGNCLTRQVLLNRLIDYERNGISDEKPLVFDIAEIFKIPGVDLGLLTCNCKGR